MAFPVRTVARPSALAGQNNGRLAPGVLKATPGQAKGPVVELVEPAARAWRALTAAAKQAGHTLKISGPSSAYRTYAMQEIIFRQRYTTTNNGSAGRWWNMRYWYKRPGVAAAAIPGTSNHGWGLAADVGEEADGDAGTESIDKATLKWLVANEERFGFSHEIQSEPWHIRYFTGDRIPPAVIAYEKSLKPKPPPPKEADVASATLYKLGADYFRVAENGQSKVKVTNATARAVDNLKYGPTVVLTAGEPELTAWVQSVPTNV